MTEEESMEQRAKDMGWVAQDDFRGNPENWRTAEEFVAMAENSLPHLKGTLGVMEKTVSEQRALIESMRNDFSEFVQFSKDAEQRAYDRALKDLQDKQAKAKAAGDLDAFVEATEEIQAKIAEHPATAGKPAETNVNEYEKWANAEPGVYERWVAENPWLNSDPELFVYAEQMDRFLSSRDGLTKPRSYRLAEITRLVKEKHPDKFGNPARRKASPVEGDTGGSPSNNGRRSYNDLPPEAQKQCDKWSGKSGDGKSGTIPGFTRQQFLDQYKWD